MWKASNYSELNKIEEAIECFKEVIRKDPKWPLAQGFLVYELQTLCIWESIDSEKNVLEDLIVAKIPAASPFMALSIFDDSSILHQVAKAYIEYFKEKKQINHYVPESKQKNKKRPLQERARMDRIRADAYHAAQASVRDEKGKGKQLNVFH